MAFKQDTVITLIGKSQVPNGYGRMIETEVERPDILCQVRDAYRSEFTSGQQSGLAEQYVFITHPANYKGEALLEYEGERYAIIRPHKVSADVLELHAGLKVGVRYGSD